MSSPPRSLDYDQAKALISLMRDFVTSDELRGDPNAQGAALAVLAGCQAHLDGDDIRFDAAVLSAEAFYAAAHQGGES